MTSDRAILYDVTLPIRVGMAVYPGDPEVAVEPVAAVDRDGYAVARLSLGTHTGTHLDPPAHFFPGGLTVDQAPLDLLVGPARVVSVPGVLAIGTDDLRRAGAVRSGTRHPLAPLAGTRPPLVRGSGEERSEGAGYPREAWVVSAERVLLRTRAPGDSDHRAHAYLDPAAARALVEAGTRLVGIDSLSVDPLTDDATHRALLGSGVWILERLELAAVPDGEYELLCLPLKIAGGDGAPARVLLRALTMPLHR